MRMIITFCLLLLIYSLSFSQINNSKDSSGFRTVCFSSTWLTQEPLLIIDGIVCKSEKLKQLDPNDIVSIDILKDACLPELSCHCNRNPIIIITTKDPRARKFIISDILNGQGISGATLTFISNDKTDTLMFVADDAGVVNANKLQTGREYKIVVSSIGYQKVTVAYKNDNSNSVTLELEREIVSCAPVTLSGNILTRVCRWIFCGGKRISDCDLITISGNDTVAAGSFTVYPNPAQRGATVTINIKSNTHGLMNIRVLNLMGQLVSSQQERTIKGANIVNMPVDGRWSAGTYIIQLTDQSGRLIKAEKLIVR